MIEPYQQPMSARFHPLLRSSLLTLCVMLGCLLVPPPMAHSAPMAEGQLDMATVEAMTQGFNRGMAAFEKRDWANAIAEMEKVIAIVENYPDKKAMEAPKLRLAPVYYTVGAAAFNVPDYPKAIAAFERFANEFPKNEKVPEARLAIARGTFLNKDYAKAAHLFAELEQYPSLHDQALAIQAQCFKESGKTAELVAVVEKMIADGITTTAQAGAALLLAQVRSQAGELDQLAVLLEQLIAHRQFVENVVVLNSLIVDLGDLQAEKGQYEQASRTYLNVMPPAQVILFQKQRIEFLERRIAANEAAAAQAPQSAMSILGQNTELQPVLEQARALLEEFEKLPDYMPGLLLRNARCWYGRDKKWESILVYERLMERYPNAVKEKEAALFGCVICYADLMQVKTCQQLCVQYLKDYPQGENAGTVAYVQGAVALQAGDVRGAATLFGTLVDSHAGSTFIDQMYLMLGSAHFSLGELDDALRTYQRYITKFPNGPALEEAQYRAAIIPVFQGKYEAGWKTVEAFLKEHPKSQYAEDAKYRLMICKYAANLYDDVLADAAKWQKDHPGGIMEAEVLSLKGDCLAAMLKNQEAADAYMKAAKLAATDEVLNYALNEASKLLQKLGDMTQLSKLWEDFIKQQPDHPSVVAGIYWIGKAKTRDGKVDEAKQIIVEQLKRCLNNQKNEAVEMLLQQLAQLCWKRPRPKAPPPAPTPALLMDKDGKPIPAPDPPAPPPLPPWDAMADLEQQIAPLNAIAEAGGRPRLAYVRLELLKLLKQQEQADDLMRKIAAAKPEVLSPQLLALAGAFMQSKKLDAEATVFYNYLKDNYLKSAWLDYAYAGLGAMALAKGDARQALELYTLAANEYTGSKVKDSTLGLALALLETGRYSEAKKLFEQVAGTREWRGEATAQAVFYLGMVEEKQNKLAEAVAHYQRVFVAYQKYLPWVEKAYIKAALCFDKLGKRPEATAHLQEVLRHDKLGFEVKNEARKLLQQWGAAS